MKRSTVEVGLLVLALSALVVFWPKIISFSREKHEESIATEASGVSLTFDNVTTSLTKAEHEVVFQRSTTNSRHPVSTVELTLYQEFDGIPGHGGKGEGLFSNATFQGASENFYRGSFGFETGWLEASVARAGLDNLKVVLGPPPQHTAPSSTFQTLAFVASLGLTVQWRQTSTDWVFKVHRDRPTGDSSSLTGSLSAPDYAATVTGTPTDFELNVPLANCPQNPDGAKVDIDLRRSSNLVHIAIDVR